MATDYLRSQDEAGEMYCWRVRSYELALQQKGKADGPLAMEDLLDLGHLDQYHYCGIDACDEGIAALALSANDNLLDIGSGIGGPARYLAWKTGCRVTGIELLPTISAYGRHITERVGLQNQVSLIDSDIHSVDLGAERFTGFVSWLVFLHLHELEDALRRVFRAMAPGARFLIEDFVREGAFTASEQYVLDEVIHAPSVQSVETYVNLLESVGFEVTEALSLTETWRPFTAERERAFSANESENRAWYGDDIFEKRQAFYRHIAELFAGGNLGGVRLLGRKP